MDNYSVQKVDKRWSVNYLDGMPATVTTSTATYTLYIDPYDGQVTVQFLSHVVHFDTDANAARLFLLGKVADDIRADIAIAPWIEV